MAQSLQIRATFREKKVQGQNLGLLLKIKITFKDNKVQV